MPKVYRTLKLPWAFLLREREVKGANNTVSPRITRARFNERNLALWAD